MEVTSVFHQPTKWSQNRHRLWSPELPSYVVSRNDIACIPQKCHPYVAPIIAIACGPQNCHHIWFKEFSSHLVHRTNILMSSPPLLSHVGPRTVIFMCYPELTYVCRSHICHRMCSPELSSLCSPHNFNRRWSPDLPSHGPKNYHPHVVPRTAILKGFPELTSL
jgi:hypothetical protein